MFQYNQHKGNKKLIVIFISLTCIVIILLMMFDIKTLVTAIFILCALVGYIAFMKYRLNRTTLAGEKLIKPDWYDSVSRVNLKIAVGEEERKAMLHDLAYKIISQAHGAWGRQYTDYLKDRDAFYAELKQEILPVWIKGGGDRSVFLDSMIQYARNDWLNAGGSAKEFDEQLRTARISAKK